jgi:hypothetical protein
MTHDELEQGLRALGQATRPPNSLVRNVMQRVQQSPVHEYSEAFTATRNAQWSYAIKKFAAIAACLAIVIFMIKFKTPRRPHVPDTRITVSTMKRSNPFPTLADYRRAYAESPEAFEALFKALPTESEANPQRVLSPRDILRTDLNLY